jgi:hypothetical protein
MVYLLKIVDLSMAMLKNQMVFVNGWLLKEWLAVSFGFVSANSRFGRK